MAGIRRDVGLPRLLVGFAQLQGHVGGVVLVSEPREVVAEFVDEYIGREGVVIESEHVAFAAEGVVGGAYGAVPVDARAGPENAGFLGGRTKAPHIEVPSVGFEGLLRE